MLTESKLIYGPFDFLVDNGASGTSGVIMSGTGATAGKYQYAVKGLKYDTAEINETIEEIELEDGVNRSLMRKAEIVLTFSELDSDDIASIQDFGGGNDEHAILQFPSIDKELFLQDSALNSDGGYCVYDAEIEGSKTKITIQRSTKLVDQSNIQKNTSVTTYTEES